MTAKKHPAKKPLEPGSTLGRYELLTPIAQGGMASVWAARQTGLHGFRRTVAVKTMLSALTEDPQFEVMFLSEARNAMRVHHPNVVEILDLGEDGSHLYQVMEWIDGESLSVLMKTLAGAQQPFPLRIAVYICSRAARGLHAAHEATDEDERPLGLVHRDVSPQNLMVTYEGQVKVVDFGVAKSHAEGSATVAGQLKGKVPYMAPEQAAGGAIDRRADIFAMGTLLYRVTTGQHPFTSGNTLATYNNVIHRDPPPLRDLVGPEYPVELEQIIGTCLSKNPAGRFSTMGEVADALERVLGQMGSVSEQELAAFAKLHLGEHRRQRRAAMREAAQTLGWAIQTSDSLPRVSISSPGPGSMRSMPGSLTPAPGSGSLPPSLTPASMGTAPSFGVTNDLPAGGSKVRSLLLLGALLLAASAGVFLVRTLAAPKEPEGKAPSTAASAPPAPVSPAPSTAEAEGTSAPAASGVEAPAASAHVEASASPPSAPPPRWRGSAPRPPPAKGTTSPKGGGKSWGAGPDVGF